MSRTPFLSVILPTHNGAERISHAIKTTLYQSVRNFELIVICDACTDATAHVVRRFRDNRIRILEVNCQRDGLARNAGLDAARGDYIVFIDDDDWWLHEFVFADMQKAARQDPTMDVYNFGVVWRTSGVHAKPPGQYLPMVAGHMWRRAFIGNTRFDNAEFSSDTHFLDALIEKKPMGLWTQMPLYYYNYMRPGSLSDMHKKGVI